MVTRLSGGITPADGSDPRTFPTIWNATADTIESQGTAITGAESDIDALEAKNIPSFGTATPSEGDSLVYDGSDWVNGPRSGNAIINGDFGIWQRGTSFTGAEGYTADRWRQNLAGVPTSWSRTRESFTPSDIAAIGYGDAEFFHRILVSSVGSNTVIDFRQKIENVRTLAGQEVTLSFWARADSARSVNVRVVQEFGSGGSSTATSFSQTISVTTSWVRYSITGSLASLSGKTIGSGSFIDVVFRPPSADGMQFDLWGVQLEAGPVATPFKLAGGGSKAAELALCQRYYWRYAAETGAAYKRFAIGLMLTSTLFGYQIHFPTEMRGVPSFAASGTFTARQGDTTKGTSAGGLVTDSDTKQSCFIQATVASATEGYAGVLRAENDVNAYLEFQAEL